MTRTTSKRNKVSMDMGICKISTRTRDPTGITMEGLKIVPNMRKTMNSRDQKQLIRIIRRVTGKIICLNRRSLRNKRLMLLIRMMDKLVHIPLL
jgi:hypothetical protein